VDSDELQVGMEQEVPTLGTIQEATSIETDTIEPCAGGEVDENDIPKAIASNLPNDAAACPDVIESIDHSLRVELVKAGPEKYQTKEDPFGGTTKTIKVGDSTKNFRRSLSREWFYKTLKNRDIILRS